MFARFSCSSSSWRGLGNKTKEDQLFFLHPLNNTHDCVFAMRVKRSKTSVLELSPDFFLLRLRNKFHLLFQKPSCYSDFSSTFRFLACFMTKNLTFSMLTWIERHDKDTHTKIENISSVHIFFTWGNCVIALGVAIIVMQWTAVLPQIVSSRPN